MNPINLLTTGRTIRGFKNRSNAYSLANMGAAPNFSAKSVKSPTSTHPAPQVSQPTFFDKPQLPAAAPAMRPPAVATQPAWWQIARNRVMECWGGIARHWSARPKTSPFQGTTVQPELALEKVKVLRNDLSDEDLELVAVAKNEKPAKHEQCQTISTDR